MSALAFPGPHWQAPSSDPAHAADQSVLPSFSSLEELNHAWQLDGSRAQGVGSMNLGDQLPENDWNGASEGAGLHSVRIDRQVSLGTALQQAIAGSSSANKPKTIEETWREIQQHALPASQAASNPNNSVKVEGNANNTFPQGGGWRGGVNAPPYGAAAYPGVPPMGVAPAGLNTGLLEEILRNQRMAAFAAAAAVNASQAGQRQSTSEQAYEGVPQRNTHAGAGMNMPGAFLPAPQGYAGEANGVQSDLRNFQLPSAYGNPASGQPRQHQQQQSPRSGDNAQNPILVPQQGPMGILAFPGAGNRGGPNGQGALVMPKNDPDAEEDDDSSPRGRGRKRVRVEKEKDAKIEKRTLRMIKNRESAARSRLRKQAYTQSLEAEINELKEENDRLRRQKEAMGVNKQSPEAKVSTMNRLRRTRTGPW
ncbi:ABRE binding factor [Klebsormidium nitens]|uniref:ABRE binding factor n=1 Tax=Klebsormidium nitens TaxID=105231 RepID=A0A1Y1HZY5_KLENI|nr:ABRE binding factor [Klebsormidium nitens]|eukprot:GAQ82086.1 ABRE binding factor [Klebsormidium nitens]